MNAYDAAREARSRNLARLNNLTIGTAALAVAATAGFGWVAAMTYTGAATTATTATTASSAAVANVATGTSTGAATTSSTTTSTTTSSGTSTTTAPAVSAVSGTAHVSSGGS